MSEAPIVMVFPRGQLSSKDKEKLTRNGIVAVEADDPKSVVQMQCTSPLTVSGISGDGIVYAALASLANQPAENSSTYITAAGRACHEFVKILASQVSTNAKALGTPQD